MNSLQTKRPIGNLAFCCKTLSLPKKSSVQLNKSKALTMLFSFRKRVEGEIMAEADDGARCGALEEAAATDGPV